MPTLATQPRLTKLTEWDGEAKSPLLRTLFLSQPGSYLHLRGGRLVVESEGATPLSLPLEKWIK